MTAPANLDDLRDLICLRIFTADYGDTCSLLMEHYNVSDFVIMETAGEVAKAILGKYILTPRETL